jgi:hypothetical protein
MIVGITGITRRRLVRLVQGLKEVREGFHFRKRFHFRQLRACLWLGWHLVGGYRSPVFFLVLLRVLLVSAAKNACVGSRQ